ncbi:MAG TPA: glycosyltransferase [Chthoniobacterales bacterium]|nr:glycosyltransferase [Chthoniobacterales bacterium]
MIQSLWIGKRLSTMELLSIRSFLYHGHSYELYVYEPVENLPEGAIARDANEILPASRIFQYADFKSYAGFSNFFRYKLLLERGGWWVDTDVVCLRPFDCPAPYVFASEMIPSGPVAASAVLKCPAGSEAMAHAWKFCESQNPATLKWGETGPRLVAELISSFSLQKYLYPPEVFCPLSYCDWEQVLQTGRPLNLGERSASIHLWNEMWRHAGREKEGDYPWDCLYVRLQKMYLRSEAVIAK